LSAAKQRLSLAFGFSSWRKLCSFTIKSAMNKFEIQQATQGDKDRIWAIIQQAIALRKQQGSRQWQDGYPNEDVVQSDIDKGYGHVVKLADKVVGYVAIIFDVEPAYHDIDGQWLSDGKYVGIHRLAAAQDPHVKGVGTAIMKAVEDVAIDHGVYSIKVDTNFDNAGMLHVFDKLGYQYCGEVYFRGSARRAFEKLLRKKDL
jgi:GNAT superfamily N-acetyltransferase